MNVISEYKRIWAESEKPGGERNILDYFIYRRISTLLLTLIQKLRFSPNIITILSVLLSVIAARYLYRVDQYTSVLIGTLILNLSLICDTLDGQYSRYTNQKSEFGAWFDQVSDSLKYIIVFNALAWGCYYNPTLATQWIIHNFSYFQIHDELILILGMLIISNFFLIYFIHVSRYKLSFNPGNIVEVNATGGKRFFFGIEATLYTIFTIFLLFRQIYWLFIFLTLTLPLLWLYPLYKTYLKNTEERTDTL